MELAVLIGGSQAGTLELSTQGPVFVYDPDYVESNGSPLSVRFPLAGGGADGGDLHNWLEGLLPDDGDTLQALRVEHDIALSDTLHLLGTPMGADCAGAVQFCEPDRAADLAAGEGGTDPITETEIADWLRALQTDPARRGRFASHSDSGFSLAGMQPKVAVRRIENGGWAVPFGAVPTTHIVKATRAETFPHEAVVEHLTQDVASRIGLAAARTSLAAIDGLEVIIVERFDRSTGGAARLHQEDMCQALGVSPSLKYQRDGGPGPGEVAGLLHAHVGDSRGVERFCDYVLFQWLAASTDGHAKNYGLLLPGAGIVRLAPLYDTASWLPYRRGRPTRTVRLSMKIGEDYRLQSADRVSALRRTAERLNLPPLVVAERAEALAAAVPEAVDGAMAALPSEFVDYREVEVLAEGLRSRSRSCLSIAAQALHQFR